MYRCYCNPKLFSLSPKGRSSTIFKQIREHIKLKHRHIRTYKHTFTHAHKYRCSSRANNKRDYNCCCCYYCLLLVLPLPLRQNHSSEVKQSIANTKMYEKRKYTNTKTKIDNANTGNSKAKNKRNNNYNKKERENNHSLTNNDKHSAHFDCKILHWRERKKAIISTV